MAAVATASDSTSHAAYRRFMTLPVPGTKCQAEYVWIGGSGQDLRCKTRTLDKAPADVSELPIWNFDGSSTGQAPGDDSEVLLQPVRMVPDPFRGAPHILVLCECMSKEMKPLDGNTRAGALEIFQKDEAAEPWFGIEQEYTLFEPDGVTPLGWPAGGFPAPQGPYYCGVNTNVGRLLVESHYRACLYCGIKIAGCNAEVMLGQWEYQVGPCTGIESGDHLILSRFLLLRIAEEFGVKVSFEPKPIRGDWNGAGCHTNYSTKPMREEGGYDVIVAAVEKLGTQHEKHIKAYGEGNEFRLTGAHETASIEKFSYGVADRGSSVRIPRQVFIDKKGYFEDRRPASNMDPYTVTSMIFETTHLS